MHYPWNHNRRYNAYAPYFKELFGERVQKISVDAGFTCPNRDGTKGRGGCTYCNNNAFNPSYCHPEKPLEQQIREGIDFHRVRYRRANKYLVYFQPYSNTYAPLNLLEELYARALNQPGVIGLVIGTRPDCVDEKKMHYLGNLAKEHYITIEYGLESIYNTTLERINRQHTYEESVAAINLAKKYGLNTGAHFIFGLPGESRNMMMKSVREINKLPLDSIKFHQLQIVADTVMANDYARHPADYDLFSFDEYIDFIVRFTEQLNPAFIIERFAGEVPPRYLAGPGWGLIRNDQINVAVEHALEQRNTWQGKFF